ncbi:MAG: hypothetical protein HEP71_32665 [Roseivirga sp.]|nr:hypothetical protein [Roseivirga sp.]
MIFTITLLLLCCLICYTPVKAILAARKFNVRLSLHEAFMLAIRKTASKQLFKAISIAEKSELNLNRSDLEVHLIAGGNPVNVVETLAKYKSHSEISPKEVFAYDLSKMDFEPFATRLIKTHHVNLVELAFSIFKIDYKAAFKLSTDSHLLNPESHSLESHVKHKLEQLSQVWSSTDMQYTENFLKTQVFNDHFWGQEIKAKLISQSIIVHA